MIQYFSKYLIKTIKSQESHTWRAITIELIFNLSAGERRESGRYVKFIVGERCPLTNVSQRDRTGGQCSFPIFIPPLLTGIRVRVRPGQLVPRACSHPLSSATRTIIKHVDSRSAVNLVLFYSCFNVA